MAPWITVLSRHTVLTKGVIYEGGSTENLKNSHTIILQYLRFSFDSTSYYKFTFVWYSAKQGNTHKPTSHLAHFVPFLWPREEHRWQHSWVGHFLGQCLLQQLLLRLAAAAAVVFLPPSQNSLQIASLHTRFPVYARNQNFTDGFLPQANFFPGHGSETYNCLPCLHYVWLARVARTLYL